MGFLKECLDALFKLAALNPFATLGPFDLQQGYGQKPLFDSSHTSTSTETITLEPENASPGFTCVYPKRWKSCNTPTSRDCWLQDTASPDGFGAYSQIDINTDCK